MMNRQDQAEQMSRTMSAANQATADNAAVSRGIQQQAGERFQQTTGAFDPSKQNANMASAVGARTNAGDDAIRSSGIESYVPPISGNSGSDVVKGDIAKNVANAIALSRRTNSTAAPMAAMGDVNLGNKVTLGRSAADLSDLQTTGRMNAALLPIERQSAINNAWKPPSPWGSILQGAGTATGLAGALGAGPSWGQVGGWFSGSPAGAGGFTAFNPKVPTPDFLT
jgi:hypothetical protein